MSSKADYTFAVEIAVLAALFFVFTGCPDIHDAVMRHLLGDEYTISCGGSDEQ